MKIRDLLSLVLLAALWGASYLFIRISVPAFGPFPLAAVRAATASAVLFPILWRQGNLHLLRQHWPAICLVGLTNCALPFFLFGYAGQAIHVGFSAIFSASTPLFAALIARIWLGEQLTASRALGMVLGFAGVYWAVGDKLSFHGVDERVALSMLACLSAVILYGFSANYSKRFLSTVPPLAVATGSLVCSTLVLAAPAVRNWPSEPPTLRPWLALSGLALCSTAVAYVLFYRLIARVGPARTLTVSFLIPGFAMLWGVVFLNETMPPQTLLGCSVILLGTSLTTGWLRIPALRLLPVPTPSVAGK